MKVVLSETELNEQLLPKELMVYLVDQKSISNYAHAEDVIAIVGSRALARKVNEIDFPNLKLFQLTSAGFDGVPIEAFAQKGIYVANAGSTYSIPIAETVVFGMLLFAKRLRKNPKNRRLKIFRHYKYINELAGKKALILGAGSIGSNIAKRLSGFEMVVDGYDLYSGQRNWFDRIISQRSDLIDQIETYDYIISTLPDTEATKDFVNNELLSMMKNTAVVVNVGRKSVLNESDLYRALKTKKIGGAVLDMFEKMPNPITNKFRRLNNVIVLPGVAAISQETNIRLENHICENLISINQGDMPRCIINGVE